MDIQKILDELDVLFREGKISEAELKMNAWLQEGIKRKNHPLCLTIYNELSGLYRSTGRILQAVEVSESALSLIPVMGLNKTIQHATTLLNSATARRMNGDVDVALGQFLEAENILYSLGEQDSFEMAGLKNNLSQLYQETGQHEKALKALDSALQIVIKTGTNVADVATTHINKAISLMALNRLDEAEHEIAEAMTYYSSSEGASSPHLAAALSASGELSAKKGNYVKAEEFYEKALLLTEDRFGKNYAYDVINKNLEDVRRKM